MSPNVLVASTTTMVHRKQTLSMSPSELMWYIHPMVTIQRLSLGPGLRRLRRYWNFQTLQLNHISSSPFILNIQILVRGLEHYHSCDSFVLAFSW